MSAAGQEQAAARRWQHVGAGTITAAWVPVLLWLGVIFWLSGDQFSDEQTAKWLTQFPLLTALGLPPQVIDLANLIVRKCAHFVEYAILSMLAYRAFTASLPGVALGRALLAAIGFAVVVAACDELHQATTLTRTGSPRDVVLDSIGVLAGALSGATVLYRYAGRGRKP